SAACPEGSGCSRGFFMRSSVVRGRGLRLLVALASVLAPFGFGFAQAGPSASADGVWAAVEEAAVARSAEPRRLVPQRYLTLELDRARLAELLRDVPDEAATPAARSAQVLSLPRPDGGFERFRIVESPIMAPELAAKFPDIRTYLGQGID